MELDMKKHVQRVRNAGINRALKSKWEQGPVFVRVMEVSQAQQMRGLSMNPTVTVAFSQSMAKLEKMTINTYKKEALVYADLDEKQLSALGLNWHNGRYWTKEEEEEESESEQEESLPGLEDAEEADEADAALLGRQARSDWAAVVSGEAERETAGAAADACVAFEVGEQLQAAVAAATVAAGDVAEARLAREVAEIEAAVAAQAAQEVLLTAAARESAAEAAAEEAMAATAAVRMAADDALARATPTPARPTTVRVTPEGVTPAVTRSAAAKEVTRVARVASVSREAAATAKAAIAAAAEVLASTEEELVEAASMMSCSLSRAGLRKLAGGGYGAPELRDLRAGGEVLYEGVVEDVVNSGARLTALERAALKKYMVPEVVAPKKGGSQGGRVIDIEEVMSVASLESELEDQAPPRAAPVATPAAGAVSRQGSRAGVMVSLLRPAQASEFIISARDGILEALLRREPRKAELNKPEAAVELWLEKELHLSVEDCKAAASCDVEVMEAWMMRIIYTEEARRNSKGASGGGDGAAAEGGEAATFAAMIAAGGVSSQSDPALLEALRESAQDPSVKAQLESVKKLFGEGKPVEAAALLSKLNGKACLATVYYKSGEVKHVQGSSVIPGANAVVVLVGSVRESVEMDVARQLQGMLPPACDARELARKLVRGKVDEISFESLFGSKNSLSVMLTAVRSEKNKGGVDATSDSYLMVMRGIALMIIGYARAHPFDGEAANEWARLLSDLARAVQDGLSIEAAVAVILDPVFQDLSLRWKDVARGAALERPKMKTVMESTKEKRSVHLRQRLEMQRREAPAAGGGGGAGGKEEGSKGGNGGEGEALKKVRKQAEEALRMAKAAATAKQPGKASGPPAANPAKEWLAEDAANADKCFYFSKKGSCNKGAACRFFAGTPGHTT